MSYQNLNHAMQSHLTEDSCNKFLLEDKVKSFRCDGCGKLGNRRRYTCTTDNCGVSLHMPCGKAKASILHPFFPRSEFKFLAEPPSEVSCACCGKSIRGNSYHCEEKQKYLHLICADLPHHVEDPNMNTTLALHDHMKLLSKCYRCGKHNLDNGIDGWSYVSDGREHKKMHYHVDCFNDIFITDPVVGPIRGKKRFNRVLKAAVEVSLIVATGGLSHII